MIDLDEIERVASRSIDERAKHPMWPRQEPISPYVIVEMARRIRAAEKAVRYLWQAWGNSEGTGQPEMAVFGPDPETAQWMREQGEGFRQASEEVKQAVRDICGEDM
jgi:hypothetical protein